VHPWPLWEEYLLNKIGKFGTDVELIHEKQVELKDGIPGREFRFNWISNGHWQLKTIILAIYYQNFLMNSFIVFHLNNSL
jgi:hypothetical protein